MIWIVDDDSTIRDIEVYTLNTTGFEAAEIYSSAIINTAALLIILPLLIVYCFCQKYLVQGIERSGIVG